MNANLLRQLSKLGLDIKTRPSSQAVWEQFLDVLSQSYDESAQDRTMFEHSLEVVSQEMDELYQDLKKKSESELAVQKDSLDSLSKFLDSIIENVPVMIFLKDAKNLRFQRFNRAGEELLGTPRSELLGKSDYDFFPKEQADFFTSLDRKVLQSRQLGEIVEEPISTKRGLRWLHTRKIPILDAHGEPQFLLGVSLDITERKYAEELLKESHKNLEHKVQKGREELEHEMIEVLRARKALEQSEERLRQASKMEAVGLLAGGVAHDFNNLLTIIMVHAEYLVEHLKKDDLKRGYAEEVVRASTRGADLTHQLLAFSRQQVLQPRVLDPKEIIEGMRRMLPRLVGEDIEIAFELDSQISKIVADPSQIEQVVMNLVVNARDAMPQGGKLGINLTNASLERTLETDQSSLPPGSYVLLDISDTGKGMDRETQKRIFEPFFTTKEKGRGTGLGLATVFGIVQQSQGGILLTSEIGKGTSFKIYLPAVQREIAAVAKETTAPPPLNGVETVLVVEDEAQLRHIVVTVLQGKGYKVLEARGPSEAIEVASKYQEPIHLLLTDIILPQMNGAELASKLGTHRGSMRVLYMSGYTDDAVLRNGISNKDVAFLQKPFRSEALCRSVREALDAN